MDVDSCCHSPRLRWTTPLVDGLPVERLICRTCERVHAEDEWILPLDPPVPGSCRNCGLERPQGHCWRCGLSAHEDVQVHRELADMVAPGLSLMEAARTARKQGRRVVALKLATAAAQDVSWGGPARLLRVVLMREMLMARHAIQDARCLMREQPGWLMSWSVLAEVLAATDQSGEAARVLQQALERFPGEPLLSLQLGRLRYRQGHFGEARRLAEYALREGSAQHRASALQLLTTYATRLQQGGDPYALRELLDTLGKHVHTHPALLTLLAWERMKHQRPEEARAALQAARLLDEHGLERGPSAELARRIEARLPKQGSFWAWLGG